MSNCVDIDLDKSLIEQIYDLQQENQSLKKENKILKENAENNDKVVDKVNWENQLLKKEKKQLKEEYNKIQKAYESTFSDYQQLKDNWNKLKEFIVKEFYMYLPLEASTKSITIIIDKMQELEKGSDINE